MYENSIESAKRLKYHSNLQFNAKPNVRLHQPQPLTQQQQQQQPTLHAPISIETSKNCCNMNKPILVSADRFFNIFSQKTKNRINSFVLIKDLSCVDIR